MWRVRTQMTKDSPVYFVENTETGERRGEADIELIAQWFADYLNREEKSDE